MFFRHGGDVLPQSVVPLHQTHTCTRNPSVQAVRDENGTVSPSAASPLHGTDSLQHAHPTAVNPYPMMPCTGSDCCCWGSSERWRYHGYWERKKERDIVWILPGILPEVTSCDHHIGMQAAARGYDTMEQVCYLSMDMVVCWVSSSHSLMLRSVDTVVTPWPLGWNQHRVMAEWWWSGGDNKYTFSHKHHWASSTEGGSSATDVPLAWCSVCPLAASMT